MTVARALALAAALGCAACAAPGAGGDDPTPAAPYRYRAVLAPDADGGARLRVSVVVPPGAPRDWCVWEPPAPPLEVEVTTPAGRLALATDAGGRLDLPADATRLEYAVALAPGAADLRGGALGRVAPYGGAARPAALIAGDAYLLRPRRPGRTARLLFEGDGTEQLPWAPPAAGPRDLSVRALVDPGVHAFGARRLEVRLDDGAVFDVALIGATRADDATLAAWLAQAGREVLAVRRTFPARRLLVALAPLEGVDEASPFGMALWSDPPSLALYVGADAAPAAFARDWVAVHELMHVAHPHIVAAADEPTVWVSEGLATYLSIVARLRSGRLDEAAAWGELGVGVRGARPQVRGRTLEALARAMHAERAYLPVYWGGAVCMLDLDLALRRATGGRAALDDALAALRDGPGSATLADLAAEVDRQAGAPVAAAVLDRHRRGPALAASAALLDGLGIRIGADAIALDDAAPDASARRALAVTR